jgi:nitroreductase
MSKTAIGPLSALDAIYGRRSIRAFEPGELERSTILGLLDAAVQAPTAMLEQPWEFVVVQDPGRLRRLSDRAKAIWSGEAGRAAGIHLADVSNLHGEFVRRLADPAFNVFYDAPTLIVICARRLDPFVVADCWLAAENLMLAAYALGLGTCCIGAAVGALNSEESKADLGIPAEVTAVVPIAVGVPARVAEAAPRRTPHVLVWT